MVLERGTSIFLYIITQIYAKEGFPGGLDGKESACNVGDQGSVPALGRSLEKGMSTHSNILALEIPWTEEPGKLQSMVSQRVRHDLDSNTFTFKQKKSGYMMFYAFMFISTTAGFKIHCHNLFY